MIFNKKDTLNDTNYTSHNNTLMLKMVTSYKYFPADHSGFVHLFIPFYDK